MHILYLKDSFEPKYQTRDEVQIALQAIEKNHSVTIMTSNCDLNLEHHQNDFFREQDESLPLVRLIRCRGIKIPRLSLIIYIPIIREIFRKYDIIHAHNLGSYSSFLASIIKFAINKPMVLKADFNEPFYKKLKKSYLLRKIALKPAYIADTICTFTYYEKSLLVDLGIPDNKIWIISNGVNYRKLSNLMKRADSVTISIGFLGRFTIQKGIHNIVKPLKRLLNEYDLEVIFAGQLTDLKYSNYILGELSKYRGFKYIGFVKSSEEFFSKIDIFVIPSLWEGGPIAPLEAMAAGKAVVASDINPHREYIEHGVTGFLAKSEEEFYNYCKELIINDDLRKKMCMNAQKKVKEYDWNAIFTKVDELYKFTLNKGE